MLNYYSERGPNGQIFTFFDDAKLIPVIPANASIFRRPRGWPDTVPQIIGNYDEVATFEGSDDE